MKLFAIHPNVVKKLDGTQTQFVSVTPIFNTDMYGWYRKLWVSEFTLANTYTEYEQYINYRVMRYSDDSRRNLSSSESSKPILYPLYLVLFIMAQMGGLYQFLYLLFGTMMHKYVRLSSYQELIKAVYLNMTQKMQEMNDLSASFERNLNYEKQAENYNYRKVANHSDKSIKVDQDYEGGALDEDNIYSQKIERKRKISQKLFNSKDIWYSIF